MDSATCVEWRMIPGWPYAVSSVGQVARATRPRQRHGPMAPLRQFLGKDGYRRVVLVAAGGRRWATVHALVCEAFHGPRPAGMEVRHLNGKRDDNRAENLAWGTRTENAADRIAHGTDWNGDRHKNRVLSEAIVRDLRRRYAAGGVTFQALANEVGVDLGTVHKAVRGISWKTIGEERGGCYK